MSNPFAGIRWIWMNGELIEFEKASAHVLSHALHYGSGTFEGIRCYDTADGPAVFRLREHIRRLERTCKIYRMPLRFSGEELADAVLETIRANELSACYIRPLVWRGFGTLGVDPLRTPVETAIAAWTFGKYLGDDADEGIDVCVSSWRRVPTDSLPSEAKATGNYLNGTLVKMEGILDGYAEGIALDIHGFVSEGSGENVFLVVDGALVTPPVSASLLPGITRDTVITLAADLGIPVRQEPVTRGQLYICDEMFLTGTAAGITPVRSIDHYTVGDGRPGEITRRLKSEFESVTSGPIDRRGWRVPVGRSKSRESKSGIGLVDADYASGPKTPTATQGSKEVKIVVAWDPEILSEAEYGELVVTLGDLVRAEGGLGVKRVGDKLYEIHVEAGVRA